MSENINDGEKKSIGMLAKTNNTGSVNKLQINIARPEKYILTIGFEVNYPDAFVDGTQNLSIDYGHAFFYITKNDKVITFFSFGPAGLDNDPGWGKDEYTGVRPATISYKVSELARAYRLKLSKEQAESVVANVAVFSKDVETGEEHYTAAYNDTCAETARDILSSSDIDTPSGSGPIIGTGLDAASSLGSFVNPYKWYEDFKDKYGKPIPCKGPGGNDATNKADFMLKEKWEWILNINDEEPLKITQMDGIIHGEA